MRRRQAQELRGQGVTAPDGDTAIVFLWKKQPLHILLWPIRRKLVHGNEQMQQRHRLGFQILWAVDRHRDIEDVDKLVDVRVLLVELREERTALETAWLLLQIEGGECIDDVADQSVQGPLRDVDAADNLEQVRDRRRKGFGQVGVELGNVEDQFQGIRQGQLINLRVLLAAALLEQFGVPGDLLPGVSCRSTVWVSVVLYIVDVVTQRVFPDECIKVHIGIVRCQE